MAGLDYDKSIETGRLLQFDQSSTNITLTTFQAAYGDSNMDRSVDSFDLFMILAAGKYNQGPYTNRRRRGASRAGAARAGACRTHLPARLRLAASCPPVKAILRRLDACRCSDGLADDRRSCDVWSFLLRPVD